MKNCVQGKFACVDSLFFPQYSSGFMACSVLNSRPQDFYQYQDYPACVTSSIHGQVASLHFFSFLQLKSSANLRFSCGNSAKKFPRLVRFLKTSDCATHCFQSLQILKKKKCFLV